MKKSTELDKYFKIPELNGTETLYLYIMKDGNVLPCKIDIISTNSKYSIISSIRNNEYPMSIISDIIYKRILHSSTKIHEGNSFVYKQIRMHLLVLLRRSDMKNIVNRFYGMLNNKFIECSLDKFIMGSLRCNKDSVSFSLDYNDMVNTLIADLANRTRGILDSIIIDNSPVNIQDWFAKYNENDVEFAQEVYSEMNKDEVVKHEPLKEQVKSIRNLWGLI